MVGGCSLDSRMPWSMLPSVDSGMALQPQTGFAELEAGGKLEGHCSVGVRSSSVVTIAGWKLVCSLLFFQ